MSNYSFTPITKEVEQIANEVTITYSFKLFHKGEIFESFNCDVVYCVDTGEEITVDFFFPNASLRELNRTHYFETLKEAETYAIYHCNDFIKNYDLA